MSVAHPAASARRKPGPVLAASRIFNRFVLRVAGTRIMPLYGVLEHRGRRSGNVFHTPVVVRATSDGFIVPMPWGETTDWYRNLRAAGTCVIRWKGRDYRLDQPEVLDTASAQSSFGAFQRAMMARFGVRQYLRLRHALTAS